MSTPNTFNSALGLLTLAKNCGLDQDRERAQALIETGILSDVFCCDPRRVDREKLREVLGHLQQDIHDFFSDRVEMDFYFDSNLLFHVGRVSVSKPEKLTGGMHLTEPRRVFDIIQMLRKAHPRKQYLYSDGFNFCRMLMQAMQNERSDLVRRGRKNIFFVLLRSDTHMVVLETTGNETKPWKITASDLSVDEVMPKDSVVFTPVAK